MWWIVTKNQSFRCRRQKVTANILSLQITEYERIHMHTDGPGGSPTCLQNEANMFSNNSSHTIAYCCAVDIGAYYLFN
jgi:hypothetical protein